jgi:hypothetical protein
MSENATAKRIAAFEQDLNHFDPAVRWRALKELISLAGEGDVPLGPETESANMHCHSFFSFNAYGFSPTALAWLARRHGIRLMGIVDFDVLLGIDEFLEACTAVNVRGSAGIETRVHIPEFAKYEINSPGEPGVCYHMGIGFVSGLVPDPVAAILDDMQERARNRNLQMVERTNAHLNPVTVDYQMDVLPLTPAGTATERHIVVAQLAAVSNTVSDPQRFWADRLGVDKAVVAQLWDDSPGLQNLVRAKLMKQGGVAYVKPGPRAFPTIEEFHKLILGCGALPCAAWLDGTSAGEQRIQELLHLLIEKGVVALNIIPDRNWNIQDPDMRRVKLRNLNQIVDLALQLSLPLNVGTEMNSFGQKIVDDFGTPELEDMRKVFLDGAHFVYGHTVMHRAKGMGYQSAWAQRHLVGRPERNAFYTRIGRSVSPGLPGLTLLQAIGEEMPPDTVVATLVAAEAYGEDLNGSP